MSALIKVPETTLDVDAVESMALALNRAKGWLAEAVQIEDVREAKAAAVSVEAYIKEKELAFDAQLSATEIVRRCERRIGELVRAAQAEGAVLKRGQTRAKLDVGSDRHLGPAEAMGIERKNFDAVSDHYAMADAGDERFEQALADAKAEGNLSRANVVRKVKGEPARTPDRSEWHHNRRKIDSNRVLRSLANELEALTSGLDLMDPDEIAPDVLAECVPACREALSTINKHLRRITK